MVPANRLGFQGAMTLGGLKVAQESINMGAFALFATFFMREGLRELSRSKSVNGQAA